MPVRRLVPPLALVAAALVASPAASAQPGHGHGQNHPHHSRCVPVRAVGVGQDLGGGQTTATVSVGDTPVGTTTGSFVVNGVDGTVASFAGPIVFTGLGGTLTAPVTGTLDTASGAFTSTSSDLSGTGTFAGVTGRLTFTGTEDLGTGAFTEAIKGKVCAPPHHA
jgi:hypothetical protein